MKFAEQSRRNALKIFATALATPMAPLAFAGTQKPLIEVWKNPTCGCCKDWVAHLQANGFSTKVNETDNSATRSRLLQLHTPVATLPRLRAMPLKGMFPPLTFTAYSRNGQTLSDLLSRAWSSDRQVWTGPHMVGNMILIRCCC
jgi:hypothetical protein